MDSILVPYVPPFPHAPSPLLLTYPDSVFRIPFYAYIRLCFLLYLILPQTQGARHLYETYIHPKLEENESAIEEFIASAHERLKAAGLAYFKQAIEYLKENVLGFPPTPASAQAARPPPAATSSGQSYTQSLLARFNLPSRGIPAQSGDFYSFLSSAIGGAAAAATGVGGTTAAPVQGGSEIGGQWSSIIPDAVRLAGSQARMSFIQAQRERLNLVMKALDREETEAKRVASINLDGGSRSGSGERSVSASSASGLSKSRSEPDFVKLEAEDLTREGGEGEGEGDMRRRPGAGERGSSGWMPWGWGQQGPENKKEE